MTGVIRPISPDLGATIAREIEARKAKGLSPAVALAVHTTLLEQAQAVANGLPVRPNGGALANEVWLVIEV